MKPVMYNTITIKAEAHDVKEWAIITVGVTADSTITPTVIVSLL